MHNEEIYKFTNPRGMGSSGSAEAQVTGFCEQSNKLFDAINCGTVLCGVI